MLDKNISNAIVADSLIYGNATQIAIHTVLNSNIINTYNVKLKLGSK
jgi:hypothetical protein